MATAQCSWRACTTFMPGSFDIATDQYMLASPIRVNSTSTPSAAKARASMSDTCSLLILVSPFFRQRLRSHERNALPQQVDRRSARPRRWRRFGGMAGQALSLSRPCRSGAAAGRARPRASPCWRKIRPSRARATCTPPALAKVSSGPLTVKLPSMASSVASAPLTLTTPDASAREAPRPSMPRPSMVQVRAVWSKARLASPRNTATVGPNLTRIEPRHRPSPWSGASVGAGNARRHQRRVAQQRPDLVGRQRNRRRLGQRHHEGGTRLL